MLTVYLYIRIQNTNTQIIRVSHGVDLHKYLLTYLLTLITKFIIVFISTQGKLICPNPSSLTADILEKESSKTQTMPTFSMTTGRMFHKVLY